MVIFGASVVGYFSPAISGTYFSAGSSSDSFPSSRSFRIEIAVKLLVIEAMRNTLSAVDRRLRRHVAEAGHAGVRQLPVDDHAPGGARHVAIGHELVEEVVDVGEGRGESSA